jgi:hypothetical protein
MSAKALLRVISLLVVCVFLLITVGSVMATDRLQVIDFSAYPDGTSADAISEPGVTFAVLSGGTRVIQSTSALLLNWMVGPTTVVISLAHEAKAISFSYFSGGLCFQPYNRIQLYNDGVLVDDTTVNSCLNGTYSRTVAFDEVKLVADRPTTSAYFGIGNITLTYTLTKDECKDGGWVALGYRNQGQCVSASNH